MNSAVQYTELSIRILNIIYQHSLVFIIYQLSKTVRFIHHKLFPACHYIQNSHNPLLLDYMLLSCIIKILCSVTVVAMAYCLT